VCEGVAELQREAFGCRPVVIRNSHDPRLDREPAQDLRRRLKLSPDDFLLVTVGHAKKGLAIPEALEALLRLPANVHLAFVGKDYEEYLSVIRDKGLGGRAHVVPPVSPNEVVPFIKSGDAALILYYPRSVNYLYSLPNKFFQSVAAELPLLYPELPEIKKLTERYGLGMPIDPRAADSIAAGVTRLMNSPELREKYRRNLRVAKQELRWEKEEAVLLELISSTLDAPPPGPPEGRAE
jgi:glycosyltransferase involved in cell wall biosynthesis